MGIDLTGGLLCVPCQFSFHGLHVAKIEPRVCKPGDTRGEGAEFGTVYFEVCGVFVSWIDTEEAGTPMGGEGGVELAGMVPEEKRLDFNSIMLKTAKVPSELANCTRTKQGVVVPEHGGVDGWGEGFELLILLFENGHPAEPAGRDNSAGSGTVVNSDIGAELIVEVVELVNDFGSGAVGRNQERYSWTSSTAELLNLPDDPP